MCENEERLRNYIDSIKELSKSAEDSARSRLDSLVKPPGSLGRLEDIAAGISAITGEIYNDCSRRCVIIMASDNGVVQEGIASAPQSVTYAQTINFTKGVTGVAVLAKHFGSDLILVDVGINADFHHPAVINRKIRKSTHNIAKSHAMTRDEAVQAILIGIEMVRKAMDDGYRLIGVGEMGIGNTTTSSAVLSALTGLSVELTTGKGAGLDNNAYNRKKELIRSALSRYLPDRNDPIDVLAKVGGFDIASMVGIYLGAAIYRIPVVIDGFISAVAALAAIHLAPLSRGFMFASHASSEPGYRYAIDEIGLYPYLMMHMRLGEGSGCPLMFAIIDAACAIIKNMGTFAETGIDESYLDRVRDGDSFEVKR